MYGRMYQIECPKCGRMVSLLLRSGKKKPVETAMFEHILNECPGVTMIQQLSFMDAQMGECNKFIKEYKEKFDKPPLDDGEKMYLAPDEVRREPYRDLINFWKKKKKQLMEDTGWQ